VAREAPARRTLPGLAGVDFESFRQQEIAFVTLNLFVLAALLLLHSLFSSLLGPPSATLLITLGAAFLVQMLELLWLWARSAPLSEGVRNLVVWTSILLNVGLAILLTFLTNREDSPYFVLLALPVLQAAFRFGLHVCLGVILVADSVTFLWVWHFARFHPPVPVSEYFEAGVISLVYALMGLTVWLLVNQLRRDQHRLAENLAELERTREQLMVEEKLAVVGRLSSAVAHEIRNPVAVISSSLATADRPELGEQERRDMYGIARSEASRLERLTGDFLSYARPDQPRRGVLSVMEVVGYISEIARVHAATKGVTVGLEGDQTLQAIADREQIQRALLNLLLNAIDATPHGGHVALRCRASEGGVELEVENSGDPIPQEVLSRIFEPFFTTKPHGTGLGLAISRNVARAHGGDLRVARNEPGHVCFAMTVSDPSASG
jgi:signal transduction histidine kinase